MRTILCAVVLLTLATPAYGDLVVRAVYSTGTINSLADADALLGGSGILSETTVTAGLIDYLDGGANGNFSNDNPFPGGGGDHFAVRVTGRVNIVDAGDWTFGTNTDDGVRLRINGSDVIVDSSKHAPVDRFGTVNLSAGWHDVDLVFFESAGGAALEFFASQGDFDSFSGNGFQLVGDTANGGLQTAVPEPASAGILGLSGLALLWRRQRKRKKSREESHDIDISVEINEAKS